MKLRKLVGLVILFVVIQSLGAFSGHISENTTWSEDVIITGDTWIDEGATLIINEGVTIYFPKIDGNANNIGDSDFIINGKLITQGTSENKVIFTSMEDNPQPNDWGGIDYLNLVSQTSNLQHTDILYAYQGLHINGKLFTLLNGTIRNCGDYGIRIEDSHQEIISFSNVTLFENGSYGLMVEADGIVNSTGMIASGNGNHGFYISGTSNATFTNCRSVSNSGNGIYIDGASPSFSNTYINSNSENGVEITGSSSNPSFSNCSIESNDENGFLFINGCTGTVEYSNILENNEFGIFVLQNSLPTISYCNIYDNCSVSTTIVEDIPTNELYMTYNAYSLYYSIMFPVNMIDQIHVSGYGDHDYYSDDYKFRVYAYSNVELYEYSRQNQSSDTSFNLWTDIDSDLTTDQLKVYLSTNSVNNAWGRVSQIKYNPTQAQLVCVNSSGFLDAQHNWWGQIVGVDSLIIQANSETVNYAAMETESVISAGASYTNIAPQFALISPSAFLINPEDVTISWTDMDLDDDAQISLYYDAETDTTGTLITAGISEDSSSDSYLWDLIDVPYALYNIYGIIDDGINEPVVSYADGQVMVGPVSASAPNDSHATANSQVTIPINVANTYDNFNIISFQFIVNFDNLILTANNVETTGTLTENWTINSNITIPGQITVNGFSSSELIDGGALVNLVLDVAPDIADYEDSILNISSFEFNDGDIEVEKNDGLFTVLNEYTISGDVTYYSNAEPIESAHIVLEGAENDSIDITSAYMFPLHIAGDYELTPTSEDEIPQLVITPFDASLIARYALGTENFDSNQITAGDVNNNLQATVYDAGLIAQYSVGLLNSFEAGIWKFSPTSYSFELVGNDQVIDFDAVAIGDPSGNWGAERNEITETWEFAETILREGETVHVYLSFDQQFYSIMTKFSYENDDISFVGVTESNALNNSNILVNDTGSEILLSCFDVQQMLSEEILLDFEFEITSDDVNINDIIEVDYVLFDEQFGGEIGIIEVTGSDNETIIPKIFELKQNFPNPFNPITKIDFGIPQDSNVLLEIFNIKGQKIITLKDELMVAGNYSVTWNAEEFGSGIYFYKISAGEFTQINKMTLLK